MSKLLQSLTSDIENIVMRTCTIPKQFMCTTLVNGSLSICRDLTCLGYNGQSMTHRGDIIVHRPLRIDRRTGLLHPGNVSLTFEDDHLDCTTITGPTWMAPIPTIPFILQVFYGLEFSSEISMEEYCYHADDFTLYDLVSNKVLTPVSQDEYVLYSDYFVPFF